MRTRLPSLSNLLEIYTTVTIHDNNKNVSSNYSSKPITGHTEIEHRNSKEKTTNPRKAKVR